MKADFTACERLAKSCAVAAKQCSTPKHALAGILVWQHRDDLRGITEGGVPMMGQGCCVVSRLARNARFSQTPTNASAT
ncbi:MAG: hypothetical protein M3P06_22270 [Acidobacteriota bacterium]|nr:hypothetical protein [Acidobacteriota bacterium]